MELAGISKHISFLCARHTFATISLDLGFPLEDVSVLLGHKDLKTTRIYCRIREQRLQKQIDKWNDLKQTSLNNS